MIQPNAQVCRRLAGASLECRHSPLPSLPPRSSPVGRAVGPGPPARLPPSRAPPHPRSFLSAYPTPYGPRRPWYRDFTIHHYHRQLRHASASASARASEQYALVRVWETRVCLCVLRLDDATSRPLMAISAAGHQRVPTGPNRPGQLASVTFARRRARARARLLPVSRSFSFS